MASVNPHIKAKAWPFLETSPFNQSECLLLEVETKYMCVCQSELRTGDGCVFEVSFFLIGVL